MMFSEHLLSVVTLAPAIGAIMLALVPGRSDRLHRWLALLISLAVFALSCFLWTGFNADNPDFQFVESASWIPQFGISYHVGIDGISLLLVLLTTLLMPVIRRARSFPVLRFLGADADPDVLHHRSLGRQAPDLRGGEVLPLYDGRIRLHAGGDPLPRVVPQPDERRLVL
jgi:hypothetical protein